MVQLVECWTCDREVMESTANGAVL